MIPITLQRPQPAVRKTTTIATAVGIALVVFVLRRGADALGTASRRRSAAPADARRRHRLRKGSDTELSSGIDDAAGRASSSRSARRRATPRRQARSASARSSSSIAARQARHRRRLQRAGARRPRRRRSTFRPEREDRRRAARRSPAPTRSSIGTAHPRPLQGPRARPVVRAARRTARSRWSASSRPAARRSSPRSGPTSTRVRTAFGREGIVSSVRVRLDVAEPSSTRFKALDRERPASSASGACARPTTTRSSPRAPRIFITRPGHADRVLLLVGAMIGAMITMYARGRQPPARDRHAARARLLAGQHPHLVPARVGGPLAARRRRRRARLALDGLRALLDDELRELVGDRLQLRADAGHPSAPSGRPG